MILLTLENTVLEIPGDSLHVRGAVDGNGKNYAVLEWDGGKLSIFPWTMIQIDASPAGETAAGAGDNENE